MISLEPICIITHTHIKAETRRVTAQIGWWLCGQNTMECKSMIPIVPPTITVEECIEVIKAMELEWGPPTLRAEVYGVEEGSMDVFKVKRRSNKREYANKIIECTKERVEGLER